MTTPSVHEIASSRLMRPAHLAVLAQGSDTGRIHGPITLRAHYVTGTSTGAALAIRLAESSTFTGDSRGDCDA